MSMPSSNHDDPPPMEDKHLQDFRQPKTAETTQHRGIPNLSQDSPANINCSPKMARGFSQPDDLETKCRNTECDLHKPGSASYIHPSRCLNFPPSTSANHAKWAKKATTVRFAGVEEPKAGVSPIEKAGIVCKRRWLKYKFKDMRDKNRSLPKRNFLKLCMKKPDGCKDEYCLRHDSTGELDEFKPVVVSVKGKEKAVCNCDGACVVVSTAYLGHSHIVSSSMSESEPEKPKLSLREAAERESRAEKLGFMRAKLGAAVNHGYLVEIFEEKQKARKIARKKTLGLLNKEITLTRQAKKMAQIKVDRLEKSKETGKCEEMDWQEILVATTKAKEAAHIRLKTYDPVYAEKRRDFVPQKAFHAITLASSKAWAHLPAIFVNARHVDQDWFSAYVDYHRVGTTYRPVLYKAEQRAREAAEWARRQAERRRLREGTREELRDQKSRQRVDFAKARWERNRIRQENGKGLARQEELNLEKRQDEKSVMRDKFAKKRLERNQGKKEWWRRLEQQPKVVEGRCSSSQHVRVQAKTIHSQETNGKQKSDRVKVLTTRNLMQVEQRSQPQQRAKDDSLVDDYFDLSYQDEHVSRGRQQRRARVRGPPGRAQRMELLSHLGPDAMAEEVELRERIAHNRARTLPHPRTNDQSSPLRPLSLQTQISSVPSIYPSPVFTEPAPRQSSIETVESGSTPAERLKTYHAEMKRAHSSPGQARRVKTWACAAREEEHYFVASHRRNASEPEDQ